MEWDPFTVTEYVQTITAELEGHCKRWKDLELLAYLLGMARLEAAKIGQAKGAAKSEQEDTEKRRTLRARR